MFVPTTPIPAYGFLMYLPRDEAIALDMSVEEGMKLVISGGIVVPPERASRAPWRRRRAQPGREQPHGVMALEQVEQDA